MDTLALRRLLGDSTSFARITSMTHLGAHLLVGDRQTSPHLALVDLDSGEVTARAGRHGEGPTEFRDASETVENFRTTRRNDAWVFDGRTGRITPVTAPAGRDTLILGTPVRLRMDEPIEKPVPLDSTWLANGRFADKTIIEFLPDGTILSRFPGRPAWSENEMPYYVARRLLNRTFMDMRPDRRRVAVVNQFENRLSIFTTDGEYLVAASGPVETTTSYEIVEERFRWKKDNEMAYWDVEATDDHVYALFCGCTMEGRGRPRELHVFSWNGELEAVIPLSHEIIAFEVDRSDSTVWGAVETPYPFIAEWKLPDLSNGHDGS